MTGPLLTVAAALGVTLVMAALMPLSCATATAAAAATKFPKENQNFGLRIGPAVGDPVVRPASPTPHTGGRPYPDPDEERSSRLRSSGAGAGHGGSRPGVPHLGVPRFRGGVTHEETKKEPKQTQGPATYPSTQPFTPSPPVSFSSFSFIPSHPPPGAETSFRGDHSRAPPGKQPPHQHPTSPFPRPIRVRNHGPGSHYEDETEEYSPAYNEEGPGGFRGHYEGEDKQEEYERERPLGIHERYKDSYEDEEYPPNHEIERPLRTRNHYDGEDQRQEYDRERPLRNRGHYKDEVGQQEYSPTYERHQPLRDRGQYEENKEEEHAPTHEEYRQFPDYEDDYEGFGYEGDGDEFPFDSQDYEGPHHAGGEYRGPPIFREQYSAPRDEKERYQAPHTFRNEQHHSHYPPGRSSSDGGHHYPPSPPPPPPPRYNDQDEETDEKGEGGEPCRTVKKDGMTCEVCRDGDGGFSEHCSHSSRNSHDEAFSTKRRQHKRDAATTATPRQTNPGLPRAGHDTRSPSKPSQEHHSGSRVGVSKKGSGAPSRPAITQAHSTAETSLQKDPSRPSHGHSASGRAQERQDVGFSFHMDDSDDFGFDDDLHDFAFHDAPSQRHLELDHDPHFDFDLEMNRHRQYQQPEFYQMSAPQFSALPLHQPHASLRDTHDKLRDTHARLEKAMDQFMTKDRSSCKKVKKRGMTCYVCPRGKGAAEEECMYASMQPDGHDLHYSEESTYGTSSSSSSSSLPSSSPQSSPYSASFSSSSRLRSAG